MNASMRYQEYKPPSELSDWIKLYWVFENRSNDPIPETIVADGYPELIIHFGSPFAETDRAGQLVKQAPVIVCGQLTNPLVLQSSCDAGMIGIRFQPCGMVPFLSTPMRLLTDARVSAEEFFVDVDQLAEEVMESANDEQRVAACNRFVARSIHFDRIDVSLRPAVERIKQMHGDISVESLSTYMGTSRRNLELMFQKSIGVSPKMYCRITRFRRIYDAISEHGAKPNWIKIALDAGFFDQSHLIRDFRRFAGDTPTSFLAEQSSFAHSVNQT